MKWTNKSLGSRIQHEIFYFLVRCHLLWLARALLVCVVFYYTLLPAVRKRAYPYLVRRFPHDTGFKRWQHCFRLYLCFAQGLLERCIIGILGKVHLEADEQAFQTLTTGIPKDKGCIIVTAHIGVWQLGLVGLEELQRPLNIVQWIHPEDVDKHYFQHKEQKSKHRIQLINSQEGLNASFQIITALQRNELICLAGDRVIEGGAPSVTVQFMGESIQLPTTAFLFASMAEVPIIVTFTIYNNHTIHAVRAEKILVPPKLRHKPDALQGYVQQFADIMEEMVQQYPYHFFNF
jgi:predicted LPLAT superfamily acyltransferase